MRAIILAFLCVLQICNRGRTADIPSLRANIQTYFSQPRHHESETAKEYKLQARTFIENAFRRAGLETEVQMFENVAFPNVQFHNVIGVLKGERFGSLQDKILGVGAHYDTYPKYNTPGVDDNGAGVAAMLDVLRQITDANKAGTKRQNTIIFASFDAEELSYLGGYALTRDWLQPYLERNYGPGANSKMTEHGVIIMDTMMNFATTKKSQTIPQEYAQEFQTYFPDASANMASDDHEGDFLLLTYRKPTRDLDLATSFIVAWNGAGSPDYELESFPLPLEDATEIEQVPALSAFRRSDHIAFWHDHIPAIFISDTANYRGDMVNCYHQACDNIDTMLQDDNLKFLGKTVDAIVSTFNTLSETSGGSIGDGSGGDGPNGGGSGGDGPNGGGSGGDGPNGGGSGGDGPNGGDSGADGPNGGGSGVDGPNGGGSGADGLNGGGSGGNGSVGGAQCVSCPSLLITAVLVLIIRILRN